MLKLLFSVFDSAAGMYLEPFFAPSIDYALREFRQAVNSEKHQFKMFPSDYTLYHIGEWDGKTGQLLAMDPRSLGVAVTFLEQARGVDPAQLSIEPGEADA